MAATTEDILRAAHLMNTLTRINWLDDVWTAQLEHASGDQAINAMGATAEEIARALKQVATEAETDFLLRMIEAEAPSMNQRALEIIDQSPLSPDLQQQFRSFLERAEGITGWCRSAVMTLRQNASGAADELLEQQKQLAAGVNPPGDLPKILKCALIGAAAGAAALNTAALIALVTLANDAKCFDIE
jgi:hypothetical protein